MEKMEIKVVGFKWKQKMLITGHYEFEIVVKNKDKGTETKFFLFPRKACCAI